MFPLLAIVAVKANNDLALEEFDTDPPNLQVESQTLLFPMTSKDFDNWNSLGSAVFLYDKAVITPEATDRKGAIHTTKPLAKD